MFGYENPERSKELPMFVPIDEEHVYMYDEQPYFGGHALEV